MNTVKVKKPANHGLHLFLSIVTFGMWVPVWIICAMVGRTETHVQGPQQIPWWTQQQALPAPPMGIPPQHEWNPYKGEWQ